MVLDECWLSKVTKYSNNQISFRYAEHASNVPYIERDWLLKLSLDQLKLSNQVGSSDILKIKKTAYEKSFAFWLKYLILRIMSMRFDFIQELCSWRSKISWRKYSCARTVHTCTLRFCSWFIHTAMPKKQQKSKFYKYFLKVLYFSWLAKSVVKNIHLFSFFSVIGYHTIIMIKLDHSRYGWLIL